MTVTINSTETGLLIGTILDPTALTGLVDSLFGASVWWCPTVSKSLYMLEYANLSLTVNGASTGGTVTVWIPAASTYDFVFDPGVVPAADLLPGEGGTLVGLALGSVTFGAMASGTITIPIDLSLLTRVMAGSEFTGRLHFRLLPSPSTNLTMSLASPPPSLTTASTIDYANHDTGRSGDPYGQARIARCPVSGFARPYDQFVTDGYTGNKVWEHMYDPPEPEPRIWPPETPDIEED